MRYEYVVKRIDGDYAHLKRVDCDDEILVAMALLPIEIDEGSYIVWENFEYYIKGE